MVSNLENLKKKKKLIEVVIMKNNSKLVLDFKILTQNFLQVHYKILFLPAFIPLYLGVSHNNILLLVNCQIIVCDATIS